jgi:hypothetical protein
MASQQQGEPTEADREAIRRLLPFAIGLKGNGASAPQAKPAPDSSQREAPSSSPCPCLDLISRSRFRSCSL